MARVRGHRDPFGPRRRVLTRAPFVPDMACLVLVHVDCDRYAVKLDSIFTHRDAMSRFVIRGLLTFVCGRDRLIVQCCPGTSDVRGIWSDHSFGVKAIFVYATSIPMRSSIDTA